MKKIKFYLITFLCLGILLPYLSQAATLKPLTSQELEKLIQDEKNNPKEPIKYVSNLSEKGLKNATLGNCLDVYNFGNIYLNLNSNNTEYQPGDYIQLKGEIKNKNNYPLPDLKLKAKIVKVEEDKNNRALKVVDEFIVKDNINLDSLQTKKLDYIYNLPIKAASGKYEILFSVIQYDQISIAGLSFSEDVYVFKSSFTILGNNQENISIKQKEITVNDESYNNLSFNPRYNEIKPVTIKVPIQNNTNLDQEINLAYEIYSWSDDLGKPKKSLVQQKTIVKQGISVATYTIDEIKNAVYYIKVKVSDSKNSENIYWQNIANIRFSNEKINEPRIATVLFNTAPYAPEKDLKLLTCIHNTNDSSVELSLENIVKDEKGKIIANSTYSGSVQGQVDGIYTPLPKDKKYNKLLVISTIKDKDGNILNSLELSYDCKKLNENKCTQEVKNINIYISLSIAIALLLVILFIYKLYKNKKLKSLN